MNQEAVGGIVGAVVVTVLAAFGVIKKLGNGHNGTKTLYVRLSAEDATRQQKVLDVLSEIHNGQIAGLAHARNVEQELSALRREFASREGVSTGQILAKRNLA